MNQVPVPSSSALSETRVPSATEYDAGLIGRFLRGEEAAFSEIVSRYRSRMFNVAWGLLRNRGDAEEVAQDTFIRAHRGLSGFRGESSLASWLHRITLNLARNRYWYFHRRRRHLTDGIDQALGAEGRITYGDLIASDEPGPVHEATRREFLSLVSDSMSRLDPRPREILELRTVGHLSYEEIAVRLSLRVGTVKSRIARAREQLRDQLALAYGVEEPGESPGSWLSPERSDGLALMGS